MKEIGSNLQTTFTVGSLFAGELANGTFATFTGAALLKGISDNIESIGGDGLYSAVEGRGILTLTTNSTTLLGPHATQDSFAGGLVALKGGQSLDGNGGPLEASGGNSTDGDGGNAILRGGSSVNGDGGLAYVRGGTSTDGLEGAVVIATATGRAGFYGSEGVVKQNLPANPTNAQIATFLANLNLANLI